MTQNKPETGNENKAIRFETIPPITIREKDGALSFAAPGGTIRYETSETVKIALLAHQFNALAKQMHNVQAVVFANNQLLKQIMDEKQGVENGTQSITDAIEKAE